MTSFRVTSDMHSKDRTLIASLGFADKDKTSPRHDLACRFMLEKARVTKILKSVNSPGRETTKYVNLDLKEARLRSHGKTLNLHVETERVLRKKKERKSSALVGFLDGWIEFTAEYSLLHPIVFAADFTMYTDDGCICRPVGHTHTITHGVGIEVKITPEPIGSTLRQIKFYMDSGDFGTDRLQFLLVTDYDLSDADVDALESNYTRHIRLGPEFEEYCYAARLAKPSARSSLF